MSLPEKEQIPSLHSLSCQCPVCSHSRSNKLHESLSEELTDPNAPKSPRYAGWVQDQLDAIKAGATPVLLPAGYVMVERKHLNAILESACEGYGPARDAVEHITQILEQSK